MEFCKLSIQNFLAIGPVQHISLNNEGLVLIQGKNNDDTSANSNGVGKSSIVDALSWAIYGETARGISGDAVVNDKSKKDTRVRLLVKDGASTYSIVRHRKHKAHKNATIVSYVDEHGNETDISKGTEKETQELIESIVGCSSEVFRAAIYAGQEDTPDLPGMTDKNLKMLIEQAAGVERLEEAYKIASAKALSAEKAIDLAKHQVQMAESQIPNAESGLAIAIAKFNEYEEGRVKRATALEEEGRRIAKELKEYQAKLEASIDRAALEREQEVLQSKLASYETQKRELASLEKGLRDAELAQSKQSAVMESMTERVRKDKYNLDNAEEVMKEPCPACGKPHTEAETDEFKAHATTVLKETIVAFKAQQAILKDLNDKVEAETIKVSTYKAAMLDPTEANTRLREITAALHAYELGTKEAQAMKASAMTLLSQSKSALTEENPNKVYKDKAEAALKDAKDLLEELKQALKKLEDGNEIILAARSLFGPSGVRAHILDTVTPFLNERTSDYLSVLSDGNISATWTTLTKSASGELKEKFSIEVTNDKGGKSFASLSGGEKRKVRLATMLALQDLVASRATKPINLFVGDEIDDALDTGGLERLMIILERKARERGTVLVISHRDLRDWIDNVLYVTKQDGVSTITGDICE